MKVVIYVLTTAIWMGSALLAPLSAQSNDFVIRRYLMKDGLAHDVVPCLLQDSRGFIWAGTAKGLSKFDGYQFTTYLSDPSNSNSLTNDIIYGKNLWEDPYQRLWIGSMKGLDVLDLKTDKLHHLVLDSLTNQQGGIWVRNIQERKDGLVWICTVQGIYLADPGTISLRKLTSLSQNNEVNNTQDSLFLNGSFHDIRETEDGSVWAASRDGLIHWDASTDKTAYYHYSPKDPRSISSNNVQTIHIDHRGRVWVGTSNSFELFNPEDQSFISFIPERLRSEEPIGNRFQVWELRENHDGKIWICSSDALYAFDPETETFDLLLDQFVWSFIEDRHGNIWASSAQGLFLLAPKRKNFTVEYDFRHFGKKKQSFIQYISSKLPSQTTSNQGVQNILPDKQGGGWITDYYHLERFNSQHQIVSTYSVPVYALSILRDSKGMIWLGGRGRSGIFNPQTKTFKSIEAFSNIRVHSLLEDRQQNIWAATNKGLFRYNLNTRQIDQFRHDSTDSKSLTNDLLHSLIMDQSGTIWVSASLGLNKMIPGTETSKPEFIRWQTSNSDLPHNIVDGMVEGDDGTLWLGCGNMIAHFYPQSGEFRTYDYQDGLNGLSILKGFKGREGKIHFGSREGMISFHPDSLQDNPYIPPVVFTDIFINNHPVPLRGSRKDTLEVMSPLIKTISYTDTLELTYLQNDFSLEFASLNFVNPENNLYKYKLEPFETEWIEASASNRVARYTNLSPGKYTFRVIGSNNDGLWNEEGASLHLTILPPWWQTSWAYALYTFLGIALLYTLRQYTVRQERLRHALELQTMEAEKMHEIDHLKSRFFANISHEFRTPLTLILGSLKAMYGDTFTGNGKSTYAMMIRNGQRLLNLVNQLLDISKLEAGKMPLQATETDLVAFLKQLAASYESLAENKKIRFFFYSEIKVLPVFLDKDKIEKVIQNLLSNAFKFTLQGGEVILHLKTEKQHWAVVHVKDTGQGIPADELDKVFDRFYQVDSSQTRAHEGSGLGMALAKEMIEIHHGQITVESEETIGTTFTVWIPLGKAHLRIEEIGDTEPSEALQLHLINWSNEAEVLDTEEEVKGDSETQPPLILVVEDHSDMRYYIRTILQQHYQILLAENGQEGNRIARDLQPDLVISDVMMPQMDGYHLCQLLKTDELTSHIPVILLTAKADRQSKLSGLNIGADDYLTKPFDAEELRLIVRNRIEERRKLREHFSREVTLEPRSVKISSVDEQFLQRIMQIIEEHLADNSFGVKELSREVGMSRVQLFRKLKSLTDHSPRDFLRIIRLKRAKDLLTQGAGNIGEIAYLVGFQDPSYFTKCFLKQFGKTPSHYLTDTIP